MAKWILEKRQQPAEPSGPRGGKRKSRYRVFTGSKAEWEDRIKRKMKLANKGQRISFDELLEIFPDKEHRDKWRDLPSPPRGTRYGRPPEFWRSVCWHTRCVPMLSILKLHKRSDEPIPVDEIIQWYQPIKPNHGRNYIIGTLNQLWKGGAIRKFVRYHLWGYNSDGTKKPGQRGRYFGVHYAFYPYREDEIRDDGN